MRVRSILVLTGCAIVVALFAWQLRDVEWSIPYVSADGTNAGWTVALVAVVLTVAVVGIVVAATRRPRRRH